MKRSQKRPLLRKEALSEESSYEKGVPSQAVCRSAEDRAAYRGNYMTMADLETRPFS